MNDRNRKIGLALASTVALVVAYLLLSGSRLLLLALSEDPYLPLGTPATWLFLIAVPACLYLAIPAFHPPQDRWARTYRALLLIIVGLACAWGLVSYGLAGNWSFSFTGARTTFRGSAEASPYFWTFTYLVAALPWVYLIAYGLHRLVIRRRRRS